MKRISFILLLCFTCVFSYGRGWYFASAGNDNTGLGTISQPYKTIARLNVIFSTLAAGDFVYFNRGDVFVGSIVASRSGSAGNPITITSYGTGAQPIITGFETLTGWTNISGNIWESAAANFKATASILTIGGIAVDLGREPDCNAASPLWTVYDSASNFTVYSNNFGTVPIGAEIVVKKNSFTAVRGRITGKVGNAVTYAAVAGIDNNNPLSPTVGKVGFGCFIQRYAASLDVQGEWFPDPVSHKVQLYSTTNPNSQTIKASFLDTGIVLGTRTYITIDGLNIQGFGLYGIETYTGANIIVQNCTIDNNMRGVYGWSVDDVLIDNNTISNSINSGVVIGQNSNNPNRRITVTNNNVLNTGKLWGAGVFPSNNNLKAIVVISDTTRANSFILIDHNNVLYTGYMGIEFQGSNVTVSKNFVNRFDSCLDDGGAIYNFGSIPATSLTYHNRYIDSNICLNAIGSWQGTNRATTQLADVAGIYLDEQSGQMQIKGNTVGYIPVTIGTSAGGNGIQFNAPMDFQVLNNTIYGADYAVLLSKKPIREITNVNIKYNIFYQKTSVQYNFFHINANLRLPTQMTILQSLNRMASIDSNWISQLKLAGFGFYYSATGGTNTFPAPTNLANWRGDSILHDIHSTLPPTVLNNTNTNLYVNPSDVPLRVDFTGFQKVDPKGTIYSDFAIIPEWGSRILIDNGASIPPNKFPVVTATAGNDSVITLPVNSASLTGSATDSDGVITGYTWTQISGPNTAGGLPFATTTTPNVTVTGLIQGIYQFQLSATDNGGATSSKIVRVTVNAAIPNTPPTADAGTDKTIQLPSSSTSVTGTTTNGSGTSITTTWSQISGPLLATISTPSSATTAIINLNAQGTYTFKFKAVNNLGDSAVDYMQVFVQAAAIVQPTANAGSDKAITLPVTSTSATATATLGTGSLTSYTWSFLTGPATTTFGTPNSLTTAINNLTVAGTYSVKFTVLNSQGNSASDNLDIVVSPAIPPANIPPVAVAGSNQTITLPTNTASVNGSGSSDPDGTITAYQWTITGPNVATSTTPNAAATTFGNLIVGNYAARLKVTDNNGDTASATLIITVNPAPNVLPTAAAGADQVLTLPTNSTSVNGSGSSDPDGSITAYQWIQLSGPSAATLTNANTVTAGISNLVAGDYLFQLKVTGSGGSSDTAVDAVLITVNPAIVLNPPVAHAGADSAVQLPQSTVHLLGSGDNGSGTITSHAWTLFSKPVGAADPTIDDATQYNVLVSGLTEGTYLFKLTVTDSNSLIGTGLVQVVVRPVIVGGIKVLLGYGPVVN